jgi:hypothetical protein
MAQPSLRGDAAILALASMSATTTNLSTLQMLRIVTDWNASGLATRLSRLVSYCNRLLVQISNPTLSHCPTSASVLLTLLTGPSTSDLAVVSVILSGIAIVNLVVELEYCTRLESLDCPNVLELFAGSGVAFVRTSRHLGYLWSWEFSVVPLPPGGLLDLSHVHRTVRVDFPGYFSFLVNQGILMTSFENSFFLNPTWLPCLGSYRARSILSLPSSPVIAADSVGQSRPVSIPGAEQSGIDTTNVKDAGKQGVSEIDRDYPGLPF